MSQRRYGEISPVACRSRLSAASGGGTNIANIANIADIADIANISNAHQPLTVPTLPLCL
jgi:hypothetical protein